MQEVSYFDPNEMFVLKYIFVLPYAGWLDIVGNSKYVGTYHNLELNLFALSYDPAPPPGWGVLPPGIFTRNLALQLARCTCAT